jgi:hypothetical protein
LDVKIKENTYNSYLLAFYQSFAFTIAQALEFFDYHKKLALAGFL